MQPNSKAAEVHVGVTEWLSSWVLCPSREEVLGYCLSPESRQYMEEDYI